MGDFKEQLTALKNCNFQKHLFAVFGSGPLAIRGMRESSEIDIIVKTELWTELIKHYPLVNNYSLRIGSIEVLKDWKPWFDNSDALIDDAEEIEGVPFVKLKYVLIWKKMFGREKDLSDIELIHSHLNKL